MVDTNVLYESTLHGLYYHRVVQVAIGKGQHILGKVDLLEMVFELMGKELNDPNIIVNDLDQSCQKVITYIYNHKWGFEAALATMECNDHYVQEVADLMVGSWVGLERKEQT